MFVVGSTCGESLIPIFLGYLMDKYGTLSLVYAMFLFSILQVILYVFIHKLAYYYSELHMNLNGNSDNMNHHIIINKNDNEDENENEEIEMILNPIYDKIDSKEDNEKEDDI